MNLVPMYAATPSSHPSPTPSSTSSTPSITASAHALVRDSLRILKLKGNTKLTNWMLSRQLYAHELMVVALEKISTAVSAAVRSSLSIPSECHGGELAQLLQRCSAASTQLTDMLVGMTEASRPRSWQQPTVNTSAIHFMDDLDVGLVTNGVHAVVTEVRCYTAELSSAILTLERRRLQQRCEQQDIHIAELEDDIRTFMRAQGLLETTLDELQAVCEQLRAVNAEQELKLARYERTLQRVYERLAVYEPLAGAA